MISSLLKGENGNDMSMRLADLVKIDNMVKELTTMLRRRVDTSASPRFPRSTGTWWFGCSSSQPLTTSGYNYDSDEYSVGYFDYD